MRVDIPGLVLHEELGRGGSAVVFRATETAFHRDVALKILWRFDLNKDLRRRFQRECQTAGALSWHPHVVTVFSQGTTTAGFPYLTMEYLPGGSLADLVRRQGPQAWHQALDHGRQLADALAAAHDVGFLHRDVKPENSLIDRVGHTKLADFGIAAVTSGTRTATGLLTATVLHAAPEILAGGKASPASDLYSLGSTLHTLLAGIAPFTNAEDENVFVMFNRIANEPPADLRGLGVPGPVAALVERLLAKQPEDRPPDAAAVSAEIRALLDTGAIPPIPTSITSPDEPPTGTPPTATPPAGTAPAASPPPETAPQGTGTPPAGTQGGVAPREGADIGAATIVRAPRPGPDNLTVAASAATAYLPPGTGSGQGPPPVPTVRNRRRQLLVVAATTLVVGLLIGSIVATTGGDGSSQVAGTTVSSVSPTSAAVTSSATTTATPSTTTGRGTFAVTNTISVGGKPTTGVITDNALWIPNPGSGTVSRIDLTTRTVTDTITVGSNPWPGVIADNALWIPNFSSGTVSRIELRPPGS